MHGRLCCPNPTRKANAERHGSKPTVAASVPHSKPSSAQVSTKSPPFQQAFSVAALAGTVGYFHEKDV